MTVRRSRNQSRLGLAFAAIGLFFLILGDMPLMAQSGGDLSFSWDTTISYGARNRLEDPDMSIVGVTNGGTAWSVNGDDGNLNYDKGIVSNALRVTTEMDIRYRRMGGFFRVSGFYDYENEEGDREKIALDEQALDRVGTRADLLDAYLYFGFDLGAQPAEFRVGNQVISWGESTFIQNSINAINPIDVSSLRVPGAELKEALLPENLAWFSVATSQNTTLELMYLFKWNDTEIDPPGSYFSTNDFAGDGGPNTKVMLGFGFIPDFVMPGQQVNAPVGAAVPQDPTIQADDNGQYGAAFRWYSPRLNDTEFGLYFLNYHSRLPIINARTGTLAGLLSRDYAASAAYFMTFPEDIKLYGFSYNTLLGTSGIALQGEVSHRQDQPFQVDDLELLFAAMSPLALVEDPAYPGSGTLFAQQNQIGAFGFNERINGFIRRDVTQFQTTATRVFSKLFGADQAVFVWEGAVTYVHDMPEKETLRMDGPGTYVTGNPIFAQVGIEPGTEEWEHFADDVSWGYVFAGRFDYNGVGAFNLQPKFSWQHDVSGVSPGPGGSFIEGRTALTLGLLLDYQSKWSAELTYTGYSGAGRYNLINDRDFIAFNTKYAF